MIDLTYIIESADYRMYEACPEILTPDKKPYKPVLRIKYQKPRRIGRRGGDSITQRLCRVRNGTAEDHARIFRRQLSRHKQRV